VATVLYLRNTTTNGITTTGDGVVYDMVTAAGAGVDIDTVTLTNGGTEIQWTQSAGGSTIAWISGRVPAGGFTLTTTDISVWLLESNMNDEAVGRYRVFKFTPPSTVTELGGGPFTDNAEMPTAVGEMTWAGNVTDTAFSENDRILIRLYASNFTTMTAGTAQVHFNAAAAATGDSFFNIAETVAFKAESVANNLNAAAGSFAITGIAIADVVGRTVNAAAGSFAISGLATTNNVNRLLNAAVGAFAINGFAASFTQVLSFNAGAGAFAIAGNTITASVDRPLNAIAGTFAISGSDVADIVARTVNAVPGSFAITGFDTTNSVGRVLSATPGAFAINGFAATLDVAIGGTAYNLSADAGAFAISGIAIVDLIARTVNAAAGSFAITGADASFTAGAGSTIVFFTGVSTAAGVTHFQGISRPTIQLEDAGGGTYTVTKTHELSGELNPDSLSRETYLIDGLLP